MQNDLLFRTPGCTSTALAGVFALALGLSPMPSIADQDHHKRPTPVGQYLIFDESTNLAGGGLLLRDCTQDAVIVAAIRVGPGKEDVSVNRLVGKSWVNDPNPTEAPYSRWAVPDAQKGIHRLFLCYDVQPVSGPPVPWPVFCDWVPRDAWRPVEFDTDNDGKRDILFSIGYLGGPRLCSD
jgi:hypothetical protein